MFLSMDPQRFYGSLKYVWEIPDDDSECSCLSEYDEYNLSKKDSADLLAPDSDYDEPNDISSSKTNDIIPEWNLDDDCKSADDIPLAELAEKLNPGKWETWQYRIKMYNF